ncbi:MAG: hypothetical protein ACREMF_11760 [Gemmatimonadales bacterium]
MSAVMRRGIVAGAVGMVLAGALQAQRRSYVPLEPARVGPHLGYHFDVDGLVLGVQATLPITQRVELYPSFDYYFVDPGSLWALNADVKFRPPTQAGALYVGGGLNYLHASVAGVSNSDVNLNLLGGWEVRRGPLVPYVEGKLILGNGSAFQLVGGISYKLR